MLCDNSSLPSHEQWFGKSSVNVRVWISNYVPLINMDGIIYSCCRNASINAYSIHGVMSLLNLQVHYAQVTPQLSWMNDQEFR